MVSVGNIWIVRHPFHMGLIDDRDPIPFDGIRNIHVDIGPWVNLAILFLSMDDVLHDVHELPRLGSHLSHPLLHGSLVLLNPFHSYLLLSSGVVEVGSQLDDERY